MNPDSDEGDDWTKYADTGYTSTYDPWADMVPITENEEEEEEFDDDFDDLGDSNLRGRDIPRCPALAGIELLSAGYTYGTRSIQCAYIYISYLFRS